MKELTTSQQMMVDDGLPAELILSPEDRQKDWAGNKPVAPPECSANTPHMPKPKKQHPADIAAEAQMIEAVRGAEHFLASLFRGVGIYEKATAPTVYGALLEADRLENLARSTKRCMIYAVGQDGRATFLSNAFIERMKVLSKTQPCKQEPSMISIKTNPSTPDEPRAAAPKASKKSGKKKGQKKAAAAKARTPVGERARFDWKAAEEKAANGQIPKAPDFSAPTHARFIPIMDAIKEAVVAKDAKALKAIEINPVSSTPKAMDRYRNICLKALAAAKA